MQRVKTGIIGLGYWGPNVFRNFAAQEHCDLAVACDLSEPVSYTHLTLPTNREV